MPKSVLMTGANSAYLTNISSYIESIQQNSNFDRNILIYQNDANTDKLQFNNIEVFELDRDKIKAANANTCIQHGAWLELLTNLNLHDDDVVTFTDGDIELQRPMNPGEQYYFSNLNHLDVFVGYNFFDGTKSITLGEEAGRLGPTGQEWHLSNITKFDSSVYNTGVLTMTVSTWKVVYKKYAELWPLFCNCFKHYAKQQWLLSWIFNHTKLYVRPMSQVIHMHDHMPIPPATYKDTKDNLVKINAHIILFLHSTRVPNQPFSRLATR